MEQPSQNTSVGVIKHEHEINGLSLSSDAAKWEATEFPSLADTLDPLDEVRVHQHLDIVEVCLGWERNNRYSLYNKEGEQIFYSYEAAQCYARQCYGSLREFTLITTDNDDNRLLYLQRPLRCSSRCCYACCHLQEMTVLLPPDKKLAVVKERWTCCIPEYELQDDEENLKFRMRGGYCHCRCCCTITFFVENTSKEEVATIQKSWGGCRDIIGASNDFVVEYHGGLSKEEKVIILGASFLLDFNYFERHGKCF